MTKPLQLPKITHLQFMVLHLFSECFGSTVISAGQLQCWLWNCFEVELKGPKFYQFMARLVKADLVSQKYIKRNYQLNGAKELVPRRVCAYSATKEGKLAYKNTKKFFRQVTQAATFDDWSLEAMNVPTEDLSMPLAEEN